MSPDADVSNEEPYYIFTDEERDRLVTGVLQSSLDEPEPLVKLLLRIHDHIEEARLKDSIYGLMKAAYKHSIVHSINFQEYLEAIRQDQNPAEEARARVYGGDNSEA